MKHMFKDNIGYVTDEVSVVAAHLANANEESRIKFVTDLAAISRGKKESTNPSIRYQKLLKEAAGNEIIYVCPECESTDLLYYHTNNRINVPYECKSCRYMDTTTDTDMKLTRFKFKTSPSRPFEFLPIVLGYRVVNNMVRITTTKGDRLPNSCVYLEMSLHEFNNKLGKYSYLINHYSTEYTNLLYTNMRAVINSGIPYKCIPYADADDMKYYSTFIALRAKLPMFIWAQVPNTHTAISKEAQSDRVVTIDEYWLPEDLRDKVYKYKEKIVKDDIYVCEWVQYTIDNILNTNSKDEIIDILVNGRRDDEFTLTQGEIQDFLKTIGYDKEIYSRAMYYFKYKEVVMTGWDVDPAVWEHLLLERSYYKDVHKNWTQDETRKVVKTIGDIISKGYRGASDVDN